MQSAEEQAPLLAFLVRLVNARHIVEVGTFTGFSALAMAQALPADGKLIACDVSEEWTAYGKEAWAKAGVADRIDLRIAPALDTLRAMPAEPHIDFAYLDADKENYVAYWEELVPRMRPGGLIATDNVLFHGRVLDPEADGCGRRDPGVQRTRGGGRADGQRDADRRGRSDPVPQDLAGLSRSTRPRSTRRHRRVGPGPPWRSLRGHRGEQLHRVGVAGRAGCRGRGLGHRAAELERVAAGAAAVFIARHGPSVCGTWDRRSVRLRPLGRAPGRATAAARP